MVPCLDLIQTLDNPSSLNIREEMAGKERNGRKMKITLNFSLEVTGFTPENLLQI